MDGKQTFYPNPSFSQGVEFKSHVHIPFKAPHCISDKLAGMQARMNGSFPLLLGDHTCSSFFRGGKESFICSGLAFEKKNKSKHCCVIGSQKIIGDWEYTILTYEYLKRHQAILKISLFCRNTEIAATSSSHRHPFSSGFFFTQGFADRTAPEVCHMARVTLRTTQGQSQELASPRGVVSLPPTSDFLGGSKVSRWCADSKDANFHRDHI
ncbi:hypothetical protein CDAR_571581 [Caerostris darwini]|uniref:Uncharacterized protein n=1 Tax=Caerostris darwini TaxID=1538125 RepID=A0AAV4WHL5_9ARAC|nr:hypothetical protein CDAR_571581 [Caerostris darwini]